jgi:tetratricopeptide (TPR) repeat protein
MQEPGTPGAAAFRPFFERGRELAALASSLQAARAGRGTVCLISGEAGIGKSRLISEFAAECQRLGETPHWGSAWEAGGAPAYWPWIQVLRSLLSQEAGREALRAQPHLKPVIAELVPELGPSDAARTASLEPEQARFRLMDAVAGFLQAASTAAPLVLVLEDAHATDPDSLVLFEFAARQLHASRALLIASYREAEMHRPRIGNVLTRVKREAVQLHVAKLGRDSVREYVRVATGERPLEQTVAEIFKLTEGHPLYLKEVVDLGVARGGFRKIPATLTAAIRERVDSLPEETQEILGIASVLGRDVELDALAELAGGPRDRVEAQLEPALAIRLLERSAPGQLRFEHVLVREALHDSLATARRRELHEVRARKLQERLDDGRMPWSELARHFEESGPEGRDRVVDAWRRAATQAEARHAFDDAALCASRALEAASSLPRPDPSLRARLLLELASSQIRAGDLDAGRRNGTEAFNLAESLRDFELMADAALAYGSIFTFGNVDRKLVALLRKAFDSLDEGSQRRRARVLARLAAAMQPTEDPREPMKLALESIHLARGTGDSRTLLITLRSAISAIMDLGNPHERLRLNREYVELAEELGDTSERIRGYMRMVVDAMELGDPDTMDHAIDQCGVLAHSLELPQYQWIAAAFRVMQATIRGNLNVAAATLEQAERFAQRSQDPNAARALAVQRAGIAELRGSTEEIRVTARELERSFANMPLAETYLKAYLLTVLMRCGETPPASAVDAEHVRKSIQFGDVAGLCSLGEFLAAHGERELAAQVYESLLPHRTLCGHWGLLGMRWTGPAARVLGMLAATLGKTEEAEAHFTEALAIAKRMNAKPLVDRITQEWKAAKHPAGAAVSSAAVATGRGRGVPVVGYFRLDRDGEMWLCECDGQSFRLKDSRGLQMLARLVASVGRELHVLDLASSPGEAAIDAGDSGELLDARARTAYRRRIVELRTEMEEAEAIGDAASAETARAEFEHLSSELARAFGLDGRSRRAGSAVERARVNVQRRLKDAQARIAKECPAAGRHLEWALRTGILCSYRPG